MLDFYIAAEIAVLAGQSFKQSTGSSDREWKLADLKEIRAGRDFWDKRVDQLTSGSRVKIFSFGTKI